MEVNRARSRGTGPHPLGASRARFLPRIAGSSSERRLDLHAGAQDRHLADADAANRAYGDATLPIIAVSFDWDEAEAARAAGATWFASKGTLVEELPALLWRVLGVVSPAVGAS